MYLIYFFAAHRSVKPYEQTGSVLQDQHRLMMDYFHTVTLKWSSPSAKHKQLRISTCYLAFNCELI